MFCGYPLDNKVVDVNQVLRAYLQPQHYVLGYLLPDKKIESADVKATSKNTSKKETKNA